MDRGWQILSPGLPARLRLARRIAQSKKRPQRLEADDGLDARRHRWSLAFPNIRWLLALVTVLHRRLYLSSGGRIGRSLGRLKFLLLVHTGRRTGRSFVAPLLYVEDGERWIVAASNAGDERNPNWLLNLESSPRAEIQVGTERIAVEARRASPEESRRLWPKLIASYRRFTSYRARTRREIAVVILKRAA